MKFRSIALCIILLAFCTQIHAEKTDIDRERMFEMIESYETISSLWFESDFNGSMSKQLRLQAAAISEAEFETASPELMTEFRRLEQSIAEISQVHPAGLEYEEKQKGPGNKGARLQSTSSTSQGFPQPRNIDLSWTVTIENSGEPDDDPPGTIGTNGNCNSKDPLNGQQRYTFQTVAISLEAVADIAGKVCNQEVLVGDASIACVVTDVAFLIAAGLDESAKNCQALIDTVTLTASHARLDHISQDLGELSSGIERQVGSSKRSVANTAADSERNISNAIRNITDGLVDSAETASDNVQVQLDSSEQTLGEALERTEGELVSVVMANTQSLSSRIETRSDRIDASISDNFGLLEGFRKDNLRYHIEKNLGDTSGPVALFVLPGSRGGSIETVDVIVQETISALSGTSKRSSQAQSDYERARKFYDQGRFKDAYKWYRSAYKHANQGDSNASASLDQSSL